MSSLKKMGGFTLIELLVAITIIGIISMFAIVSFGNSQQRARDAQRKNDLSQLATALEHYYNDNEKYVPDAASFETAIAPYMQKGNIPKDPSTGLSYYYNSLDGGDSYILYAKLENCNDPRIIGSCDDYNYSITSSNTTTVVFSALPSPPPTSTSMPTNTPTPTSTPVPVVTSNDADGDTFQAGPIGITCPNGRLCDCYDLKATAKPGQSSYFSATRGTSASGNDSAGNTWNSYDYDCDGIETKHPDYACMTTHPTTNPISQCSTVLLSGVSGYVNIPSCGQSASYRFCVNWNNTDCEGSGSDNHRTCDLSSSEKACDNAYPSGRWQIIEYSQLMVCR